MREYPTFKADWKETVTGYFEPAEERRAIRECVPKEIKHEVERMTTMEDIWKLLDDEYGKPSELSSDCVAFLQTFQYSKTANTEAAKFKELHRCWSTVYSDLAKVDQLEALNHAPTLKVFLSKLPSRASMTRYIAMATELRLQKKSELEIIEAVRKLSRVGLI